MKKKKIKNAYPLSPMQSGLLFQALYKPESDTYFIQSVLKLDGALDVDALQRAWQLVCDHHPILRTGFVWEGLDKPLQYVLESVKVPFEVESWNQLSKIEQEMCLTVYLENDRQRGFDLRQAPLFRVKIFESSEKQNYMIWSFHHILADGWSTPFILGDVQNAYESLIHLKKVELKFRAPYQNYIAWLQQQDENKAKIYWQDILSSVEEPTRLSFKNIIRHHSSEKDYVSYGFELSIEETMVLQQFSGRQGITLNTILQGMVGILLQHYTQKTEVVMGVTISGRAMELAGIEEMVGLFINTLPLKITYQREDTVESYLNRLQKQTQQLSEYAYTSLAQIYGWTSQHQGLFDVHFAFENFPGDEQNCMENASLQITKVEDIVKTEYPLTIAVGPGKQLSIRFSYQTEHFDRIIIERMADHLRNLLKNVHRKNESPLMLPYLSDKELHQVIKLWNSTQQHYSQDKTIAQLFEEQVKAVPNNIALIYEKESLTYQELNERANQFAYYLINIGIGPDILVGIALERSIQMVIGLLGILKAGGAYVPLDPSNPEDRLAFMLEDTREPLLITQVSLKEKFTGYKGKIIFIDENWKAIEKCTKDNPRTVTLPHNLAYVIYTSGSTGRPKGVMLSHQNLINYIDYITKTIREVNSGILPLKYALFSTVAADLGYTIIYGSLLTGNQFYLLNEELTTDAYLLSRYIQKNGIECYKITPSHFNALAREEGVSNVLPKTCLIYGGEPLTKELIIRVKKSSPESLKILNHYGPTETTVGCCVYNEYGPTEATVGCCVYQVENESNIIPIGRPIANTEIYILDRALQTVPVGVIGEIYIGGDGLARGYWGRPALTAERFIPNPFANNTRLYKTGDLARYLVDGNIEFLGRSDDQVKVRGYRVELGEIEIALSKHEDVSQVVVIAREDEPGIKKIVAYLVPGEFKPSPTELREYLEEVLPDYMIPSIFVYLEQIPLTLNGKVDRKALPLPDFSSRSTDEYVAPRNEKEQLLSEVWASVLGVERVGVKDHFFRIGGDSIISIRLVSKARQKGIRFSVKDVFNYPTVEALAIVSQDKEEIKTLQVQQSTENREIPLTPIQHWFFQQKLAKPQHFNQAVLLKACNKLESSVLVKVLEYLVLHHDGLRMRYIQKVDDWHQEYHIAEDQKILETIDLSSYPKPDLTKEITRVCDEIHGSFNLELGPLIKVALINCGNEPQRLLIVLHHLVVDGISWRILLEDLEDLYNQEVKGQTLNLSRQTHSYQQWSDILRTYAKSSALQDEEPYWRAIEQKIKPLSGKDTTVKEQDLKGKVEILEFILSNEDTRRLLHEVSHAYRTEINDVLLTALTLAIEAWMGIAGISLSLEGHGREEIIADVDISRTIGWFTSRFPVYLEIPEKQELGKAIKVVKEILRGIPKKGIGYGILRYLTEAPKDIQHPSISFNYLGQWDQQEGKLWKRAQESVGLTVSPDNKNLYSLNINAEIREGQLRVYWVFDKSFTIATIEKVGNSFINYLQKIIHHCCQEGIYGYTPSDFPLASLTQKDLDKNFEKKALLEDIYPLSSLQAGLLFQALYEPDSDTYFVQSALKLEGDINKEALQKAWQTVCDHHVILRTGFVWDGLDKPLQYVLKRVEVPFEFEDWKELTKIEQEKRLAKCLETDRLRGFDMRQLPLFRIKLIECFKDQIYMIWSSHHILSDGWSTPLIMGDVLRSYEALLDNKKPILNYRPPYKNYIAWLQKQDETKAREYWQEMLALVKEPTRLSFKNIIKESSSGKGYETFGIELSIEETEKLQRFAGEQQVTLNTVLQGALGLLLQHYTQKTEIVMGVTISGRTIDLPGIEEMVGLFINTLPLKVSCQTEDTVNSYLKRLQRQTQQLNEYTYSSLAQIYGWASQYKGLFDVLFVFENYPVDELVRKGGQSFKISNTKGIDRIEYPLTILVGPGKQLYLRFNYQTERFDTATIERMATHLKNILQSLQTKKGTPLGLPYLSDSEIQQLVLHWNSTNEAYPQDKTVSQLFAQQVKETPNNIAVIYEEILLTYQQLNEKVNKLANYLITLGVGPNILVALAVDRSLDMVVGLLAVLKAGATYVPLDPSYPVERLTFMLEDTKAPLLITQSHFEGTLQPVINRYQGKVIFLDMLETEENYLLVSSAYNSFPLSTSSNLAYVIYTSGSTGKPKGVMVSHKALVNFLMSLKRKINIDNTTRLLAVTTLAFDIAGLEIYSPLLSGGTLILVNKEVILDPSKLEDALTHYDTTIMQATPTLWKALIDNHWKGKENLKVLCGGENTNLYLLNQLMKNVSEVWNLYGPTETTIWSSACHYTKDKEKVVTSVSIGTPIANTQIYILDPLLNLVPIGVTGEIYIGGLGLARGYLNKAGLTAEKFVPNPFLNQDGTIHSQYLRLYRTGDIARYGLDGNIEFICRIDDQVKIRGFRIELGEIESTLNSHAGVAQAVVVAREDEPGKKLVAYVVPEESDTKVSTIEGISRWQTVYNDVYKDIKKARDVAFNTIGWNSSYTGESLPDIDMAEWVDNTVRRILSLKPKRVLEIGCGAGLLLSKIAPSCEAYWGTDFSERAINHLAILKEKITELKHIQLLKRDANNFEGVEAGYFDVVVLNSVIQYFPNVEYLKGVLKGAINTLRKGGIVFIGDVRSFTLLKAYAASVEYFRASDGETKAEIEKHIHQRLEQEKELVINPRFFVALQNELKGVRHVKINPKRGMHENELTKFRYDVLLYVHQDILEKKIEWLQWKSSENSLINIENYLAKSNPKSYGLQQVFNEHLQIENKLLNWLDKADKNDLLKDFNETCRTTELEGINPEYLWQLGEGFGYKVEISWQEAYDNGEYDVAFIKEDRNAADIFVNFPQTFSSSKLINYTNNPSQKIENRERTIELQEYLSGSLPEYMVPASFVYLQELPLTPNGKLDRKALPSPDFSSRISEEYEAPRNERELKLSEIWGSVLGIERVGIKDNFFYLGGDSIISIQLVSKARQKGISFSVKDVFNYPTVEALASISQKSVGSTIFQTEQGIVTGEIPLTPVQHRFFNQKLVKPQHFNQTILLKATKKLDIDILSCALTYLFLHHDVLRMRYRQELDVWHQECMSVTDQHFLQEVDLSSYRDQDLKTEITKVCNEAQAGFDLALGPLIKCVLMNCGEEHQRLLIVLHHLIGDGVSWRILLEDLEKAYEQKAEGKTVILPPKTHSYQQWSNILQEYAKSSEIEEEASYWEKVEEKVIPLPDDIKIKNVRITADKILSLKVVLNKEDTHRLLQDVPRVYETEINDSLLTALAIAIEKWSGIQGMSLSLQAHGREEIVKGIDVSRTVGWFISIFPVYLEVSTLNDIGIALKTVKEVLRGIPNKGIGYGVLKYLKRTKENPRIPSMSFNYLGQWDHQQEKLWEVAQESTGMGIAPENESPHKIIVNAEVREGQLQIYWSYSCFHYNSQTIEGIANNFILQLQELIEHCCHRGSKLKEKMNYETISLV